MSEQKDGLLTGEARENMSPTRNDIQEKRNQVTVVIPTLDEEQAIGPLIEEIHAAGYERILVVDGYSTDRTADIAAQKGATVLGQHGKGKTGAILVARDIVNTPFFLLMDGDYTYDPADIDRFMAHADNYDHIVGFRPRNSPFISRTHKIGNWVLTTTFNILMGSNVPDVACGMYLMRTDKMKQLNVERLGFEVDQEIAAQMLIDGRVTYVPINYRRRVGDAKAPTWRQGFRALFAIAGFGRRYNPILLFAGMATLALIPAFGLLGYASLLYLSAHQYHGGYFLAGISFLVLGAQGFTVATIAALLRRMERKLSQMQHMV